MKRFRMKAYLLFTLILGVFILPGCGGDAGNGHWDQPDTTPTDITAPRVTVITPANAATGVSLNRVLSATFSEDMKSATLISPLTTFSVKEFGSVSDLGGTVTYNAATRIATLIPTIPFAASTKYTATISIAATDTAGNPLAVAKTWIFTTGATVDTTAPTVTLTAPANAATGVALSSKVTATFSEDMDEATLLSPLTTFSLQQTVPGTNVGGSVTYLVAGRIATFTPAAPLIASTKYTATITTAAKDDAGNILAVNKVWTFTTGVTADTTAPTITSTGVVDGAIDLPINRGSTATFSEPMDPATLIDPATTFTVTETLLNIPVDGAVTYIGNTATFNPDNDLKPSTKYTSTITTAAKDLAGNSLRSGVRANPWSWTTGAAPDTIAPEITLTSPADGAIGVSVNSAINATFSEPMAISTMSTANFMVQASGTPLGSPLLGSVTYNDQSMIATFVPDAPLDPDTEYTVTVTKGATDESRNELVVPAVADLPKPNPWVFTTASVVVPPPVALIDLNSVSSFGIMATSAITNTGAATMINGDVSLDPGSSNGLLPVQVNGTIHINDTVSAQARIDLLAAYNAAKSLPPGVTVPGGMDLGAFPNGGLPGVLPPGTYTSGSTMLISTPLTLDAQGDANASWVFQIGSSLTTTNSVSLSNGAQAKNVYWVPTASATIGVGTIFNGNIIAGVDATGQTGAVINGRILAGANNPGTIALDTNTVNVPAQ